MQKEKYYLKLVLPMFSPSFSSGAIGPFVLQLPFLDDDAAVPLALILWVYLVLFFWAA